MYSGFVRDVIRIGIDRIANMTEFIIIMEWDNKDGEHSINYVQWTGNEENVKELLKDIDNDPRDGDYGECYSYTYSLKRLTESTIDPHLEINDLGLYFNKYSTSDMKKMNEFFNYVRKWVRE